MLGRDEDSRKRSGCTQRGEDKREGGWVEMKRVKRGAGALNKVKTRGWGRVNSTFRVCPKCKYSLIRVSYEKFMVRSIDIRKKGSIFTGRGSIYIGKED